MPPFALRTPPGTARPTLRFQSVTEFQGIVVEASDLGLLGVSMATTEQALGPVTTPEWLAVELLATAPGDDMRYGAEGTLDVELLQPAAGFQLGLWRE